MTSTTDMDPIPRDTASRILDVAEEAVQTRGYNGFSYADVAAQLGVSRAALHHHFRGKAELGEALVLRYASRFADELVTVDASGADAPMKLDAYARLYGDVLRSKRMCLCGMLAAEYHTLPEGMQLAVRRFFDESERWLEQILEQGRDTGTLRFVGPARDTARMIISSLEGAMLVSRPYGTSERFQATADELLANLTAPRRGRARARA